MKRLLVLGVALAALLLAGDPDVNADVSVRAARMSRQGAVHQLRGDAQLETSAISIRADEIDYNQQTNEIEARGSVRIKLKGNPSYLFVDGTRTGEGPRPPEGIRGRPLMPPEVIK